MKRFRLKHSPAASASVGMKQVASLLLDLQPDELKQIRLRVTTLLSGKTAAVLSGKPVTQDWLLEGITLELRRRGLWSQKAKLPVKGLAPNYLDAASLICEQLLKAMQGPMPATLQMQLGLLVARALADYLLLIHVPVGPKTMLQNVDKLLLAVDESYPGYVEAGILRLCLSGGTWQKQNA